MSFTGVTLSTLNTLVLSKDDQTDATTAQTLDINFQWGKGSLIKITPAAIRSNKGNQNGYEEATGLKTGAFKADLSLVAPEVFSELATWIAIFGLGGTVTKTNLTVGYKYVAQPASLTNRVLPYFTAGAREGGNVSKLRAIGMVVNGFDVNFTGGSDSFTTMNASCIGLGKYDRDPKTDTLTSQAYDATTITVSEAVYNDSVDSIQLVKYDINDDGTYAADVTANVTGVSSTTVTFSGGIYPTGSGSHKLKIIFRTAAVEAGWGSTVSVTPNLDYLPFTTGNMTIQFGYLSGAATAPTFNAAGRNIACELISGKISYANNAILEVCASQSDPTRKHHDKITRGARTQSITLTRKGITDEFWQIAKDIENVCMMIKWEQDTMTGGSDREAFGFYFNKLQTAQCDPGESGDYNTDTITLEPMEDTSGTYPTVIAFGQTTIDGLGGY